jgi:hypothetical protein
VKIRDFIDAYFTHDLAVVMLDMAIVLPVQ